MHVLVFMCIRMDWFDLMCCFGCLMSKYVMGPCSVVRNYCSDADNSIPL